MITTYFSSRFFEPLTPSTCTLTPSTCTTLAQRMEGAAVLRAINALVKRSELEEQNQGKRLKRVR